MIITTKITYDLSPTGQDCPQEAPGILAVEGDTEVHQLEISLYAAGEPWAVPEDATVLIGYAKGDGTGGTYDTLPDGSSAWQIQENAVTVTLLGQILAAPGPVWLSVALLQEDQKLNIFQRVLHVRPDPTTDLTAPQEYVNLYDWLTANMPQIVQELGASPESVMSQAAVTQALQAIVSNDTAVQLPDYWQAYLPARIETIRELQRAGGAACISFPILADLHVSPTSGRWCGLLAKTVMDACGMPYALYVGDSADYETTPATQEAALSNLATAQQLLGCLKGRLLQTQGDFDAAWGSEDLFDTGVISQNHRNLLPEAVHGAIYRPMALIPGIQRDDEGWAYSIDDAANRVRYIILNSHRNTYEENDAGVASHNTLLYFRFGASQCEFLINALNSVPGEDWLVVTASHVPMTNTYQSYFGGAQGEHILMRKILAAYKNKTTYSGSFAGTYDDDAVTVSADFTSAKGTYVAHFSGHTHKDSLSKPDGFPIITIRSDGIQEPTAALRGERTPGTATEHSFVVFTVNRQTRTLYGTRIGAGKDLTISY